MMFPGIAHPRNRRKGTRARARRGPGKKYESKCIRGYARSIGYRLIIFPIFLARFAPFCHNIISRIGEHERPGRTRVYDRGVLQHMCDVQESVRLVGYTVLCNICALNNNVPCAP